MATNQTTIDTNPLISEDWNGGYKLELGLTAEAEANNWKIDFELPYTISAAYGVDLVDNGNGSYTISGQNEQVNLSTGQSIQPIFIIEDNGQEALAPQFTNFSFDSNTTTESVSEPIVEESVSETSEPVEIAETSGQKVGQQGKFAYGEALQKNFLFLEANRSGDLGPDNRLEWRTDSTLNDGSTVGRDLSGGYFDAGDHVKFGQPMAASVNMLAWGGVEYTEAYKQSGQFDELLEAVKWGTDYFLKAHETNNGKTERLWVQVGEGGSANDHGYWGAPETVEANTTRNAFAIDPNNPGSDVAASTSSALAAASMLFRGVDNAYADRLLNNAKQLYEFAETYQGKYSDSVSAANPFYTSWSGYGDELASGAAWLHKATGEQSYLTKAENYFKNNVGGLGDWSWAADDHSYGAAVILAQESDDPFFKSQVEGWLDKWINGGGNINYTTGGFAHRARWGSVPVTSSAAYLAQLYNDTVKEDARYSDFANNQVDYILGDNPANLSYMIGFGDNYPQSPHHRGSAPNIKNDPTAPMENILYGAVVGGPDAPDDYAHNDRRDDWVTNEVGTSYNAPFASALIQQYDNLGGDPLSESELDQLIGVDANGVGF
ncbi:MAG: glycoside hydrolase family 9 protein [Pleurocapsa sp. MO_226.B13]|nr:glycoside hydrolase family 9 protein [Pleurocapsa sp. MO_226.B13]